MPDDPKPAAPSAAAVANAAAHVEEQIDEAQAALDEGDAKTAELIKKELDAWLKKLPQPLKDAMAEQFASLVADVANLRKELTEALAKFSTQQSPSDPPKPTTEKDPPNDSTSGDGKPASDIKPAKPDSEPPPAKPGVPAKKPLRKL